MNPEMMEKKLQVERLLNETLEIHRVLDVMRGNGCTKERCNEQKLRLTAAADRTDAALHELMDMGWDEDVHGELEVATEEGQARINKYLR